MLRKKRVVSARGRKKGKGVSHSFIGRCQGERKSPLLRRMRGNGLKKWCGGRGTLVKHKGGETLKEGLYAYLKKNSRQGGTGRTAYFEKKTVITGGHAFSVDGRTARLNTNEGNI